MFPLYVNKARLFEFHMENLQRDSHHWLLPPMSSVDPGDTGHRSRLLVALDDRTALLAILFVATAVAAGTLWIVSQTIDLYFPADAGEYVADARALLGGGVREIRHAPLFPLLVALSLGPLGPVLSTQLSMAIAIFLLPVGLFLMLRQWLPVVPSLTAASVAALTPMTADLVGWGGGATFIGLDMMVLAIATMEAWLRETGKQGPYVGVFAGLTVMAHPFMAAGMFLVLAVRWLEHALSRRHFSTDWSALGLRGFTSFFVVVTLLFGTAAGYYLSLRGTVASVSLDILRAWDVLVWGTRGNLAILFFILLALALPLQVVRSVMFLVTVPLGAIAFLIPLLLSWDITYNLRVVYFLPILVAVGVGLLSQLTLETFQDRGVSRTLLSIGAAVLLVAAPIAATYGFGYIEWTQVDSSYYQRIHSDDLPAFEYLRTGQGTVATSWSEGLYDEGKVNGWFVEGLSNRPAIGPGAPWTWTIANVGESELDLQRFFSGTAGIENGAIQASVSPTGHLADPAIQVDVAGFYYPLAYLNSLSNGYPTTVTPGVVPTVGSDTIEFRQPSTNSSGVVTERIQLNETRVIVRFSLTGGSPSLGDWEVWIWPAYFVDWAIIDVGLTSVTTHVVYRTGSISANYSVLDSGSTLRYYESHPIWGIPAIAVRRSQATSVSFEITVAGTDPVRTSRQFDEKNITKQLSITTVLLWMDTGWMFRFDNQACYRRSFVTPNLVVYEVEPACRI